jgi:hypothetical protein
MDKVDLKIDQKLAQAIFDYLATQPAKDVFHFLVEMKQLTKCECNATPKVVHTESEIAELFKK